MSITLWKPETDVILHQALGKCAEECAELSQALARCLIQGFHEAEPITHKLNRTHLFEEVADLKAALRWLFDVLDEPFKGESERERRKFDGFKHWENMLEGDRAGSEGISPHAFAQEYEFRGDTDHTPSDSERTMIEDAICGYLSARAEAAQ